MPEQEKLADARSELAEAVSAGTKLERWVRVQVILEEVHSELEAQVKQFGDHLSANDMSDNRDELVQLAARAVQAIYLLDRQPREAAGG